MKKVKNTPKKGYRKSQTYAYRIVSRQKNKMHGEKFINILCEVCSLLDIKIGSLNRTWGDIINSFIIIDDGQKL